MRAKIFNLPADRKSVRIAIKKPATPAHRPVILTLLLWLYKPVLLYSDKSLEIWGRKQSLLSLSPDYIESFPYLTQFKRFGNDHRRPAVVLMQRQQVFRITGYNYNSDIRIDFPQSFESFYTVYSGETQVKKYKVKFLFLDCGYCRIAIFYCFNPVP